MKRNLDFSLDEFLRNFQDLKEITVWADYDRMELQINGSGGLDRSSWEETYERVLEECNKRRLKPHILSLSGSYCSEHTFLRGLRGETDYFVEFGDFAKAGLWIPGCFCCANQIRDITLTNFYAKKKSDGFKLAAVAPMHHLYRGVAKPGQSSLFPGLNFLVEENREKYSLAARDLKKVSEIDSKNYGFASPKDATFFRVALPEITGEVIY